LAAAFTAYTYVIKAELTCSTHKWWGWAYTTRRLHILHEQFFMIFCCLKCAWTE